MKVEVQLYDNAVLSKLNMEIVVEKQTQTNQGRENGSIKQNLHYNRGITPKHATSGAIPLYGLVPGQHSSEETSQRW